MPQPASHLATCTDMTIFDELKAGVVSSSPKQTEEIGVRLAAALPDNSVLSLSGELGTGKTTLVRGLARGLGITRSVTSPTYTIYTLYERQKQLVHMDAYRLSNASELEALTIEEFLRPPYLIALEWPEHVPGFLDVTPTTALRLELLPDHRHRISLT
jgi:tRNA threonylcarbamoyladenosine biosynthesis protein TsaE